MDSYFKGERKEVAKYIPEKVSRVLEIGCGEAEFKNNFSSDVEYWIIEPDKKSYSIASKKVDKAIFGNFEDSFDQLPKKYFDLIVCNDVIEHMVDHDTFFINIKENISPNGYLLISIPNVRYIYNIYNFLVKKDWEYTEEGILDKTHLRFFTEKSLKRVLKENNFETVLFEKINNLNPNGYKKILKKMMSKTLGEDVFNLQFLCLLKIKNMNDE